MSRTYKTAPYLIRASRIANRPVPSGWRDRWSFKNIPLDNLGWDAWWADRPQVPAYLDIKEHGRADRSHVERRHRARQRQAITTGDYDSLDNRRPRRTWY